jgi:hypothetical protein
MVRPHVVLMCSGLLGVKWGETPDKQWYESIKSGSVVDHLDKSGGIVCLVSPLLRGKIISTSVIMVDLSFVFLWFWMVRCEGEKDTWSTVVESQKAGALLVTEGVKVV